MTQPLYTFYNLPYAMSQQIWAMSQPIQAMSQP